jgi:uncharacterized surface protein with fasciclin (FAS1) repeats
MRSNPSFVIYAILLFICVAFSPGCVRSNTAPANNNSFTIDSLVQSSTNLTLLNKALIKSRQDITLRGTGPFTLFAPTDAAFAATHIDEAYINGLSDSALTVFVLYQIIDSAISSNYLPAGPNGKLITASGDSLFVTALPTGIYINGVQITQPDVLANNGIIDALRFVLLPPKGNILQVVQSDTTFSYLAAAISRASTGNLEVATLLSSGGPFSLLAPANSAFQGAGYSSINDINNANPDSLAKMLTYQTLKGRLFTSDLAMGGSANTVYGESVILYPGTSISVALRGQGNDSLTNITTGNIMARNGVVHIIDRILLP